MNIATLRRAVLYLGGFAGLAYLVIGIVGGFWPGAWDEATASEQALWLLLLLGGAILVLTGLWLLERSPSAAAALVSIGAVAGALAIFWTVVSLLVALALILLSVMYARRRTGAERPATEPRSP